MYLTSELATGEVITSSDTLPLNIADKEDIDF